MSQDCFRYIKQTDTLSIIIDKINKNFQNTICNIDGSGTSGRSGISGLSGLSGISGENGSSTGVVYYLNESQTGVPSNFKILS